VNFDQKQAKNKGFIHSNAPNKVFIPNGHNGFCPFFDTFCRWAKPLLPVFGGIFVMGKTHYARF